MVDAAKCEDATKPASKGTPLVDGVVKEPEEEEEDRSDEEVELFEEMDRERERADSKKHPGRSRLMEYHEIPKEVRDRDVASVEIKPGARSEKVVSTKRPQRANAPRGTGSFASERATSSATGAGDVQTTR